MQRTCDQNNMELKIPVLGDSGSGKTALVRRITHNDFSDSYSATIGVDFSVKHINIVKEQSVKLQFWDLAGQDRFNHLSRLYYKYSSGVLLVCDENREGSLESVARWRRELDSRLEYQVPAILLLNKADLVDPDLEFRLSDQEIQDTCTRLNIGAWSRSSAKEGYGIEECLKSLVWQMLAAKLKSIHTQKCSSEGKFSFVQFLTPYLQDLHSLIYRDQVQLEDSMSSPVKKCCC